MAIRDAYVSFSGWRGNDHPTRCEDDLGFAYSGRADEERQFTQNMPNVAPEEREPPLQSNRQSGRHISSERIDYPSTSRMNEHVPRAMDIPEDAILLTPFDEVAHTMYQTPNEPYGEGTDGGGDFAYTAAYARSRRQFHNTPIPFISSPSVDAIGNASSSYVAFQNHNEDIADTIDNEVSHPHSQEDDEGRRMRRGRRNIRRRGCGTHDYYFPF